MMSSKSVSNWLTLSANLAVLVGIVLVLAELNQNSDLMRAQITQIRADNLIASMESRMHSEHWPTISAKLPEAAAELQNHRGDVIYTAELLDVLDTVERERVFYSSRSEKLENQSLSGRYW
jgi:predicted hotdog family 3-hydroxylacyl-ACP dehydratase